MNLIPGHNAILRPKLPRTAAMKALSISASGRNRSISACTFLRMAGQDGMRPILLLVHGGGWRGKKVFPRAAALDGGIIWAFWPGIMPIRAIFAPVSITGLLGQPGPERENELIDLYEDCMDAAEYVRRRAADWHADARRMLVLGESAGGYLAAAMATLPLRACGIFAGAILVNAITDLTDASWAKSIAGACAHPLLAGKSLAEKAALLSPCANIRPGLPPCCCSMGIGFVRHAHAFRHFL